MTFDYNDYETIESFSHTDPSLYWDDINNPNNLPYDEEIVDIVKFGDDIYRSFVDWCNKTYADVDEDELDEFFQVDEESWWNDVKDSFNAEDYKLN